MSAFRVTPGDDFSDIFEVLGLLAQKIESKLALKGFSWPAKKSYHMLEAVACLTPPAGISYLTHLEAFLSMIEKASILNLSFLSNHIR